MSTAPMDLNDDERTAYRIAVVTASNSSTNESAREGVNRELALYQKLSDARAALRQLHAAVLDEIVGMEEQAAVDDSEGSATNRCAAVALRDAAKFMRQEIDRALATPTRVAVPAARKEANGVTNFTDTQKAERQAALASMKPTRVGYFTPAPVAVPAGINAADFKAMSDTVDAIRRGEVVSSAETRELARMVIERRATETENVDDEKWTRELVDSVFTSAPDHVPRPGALYAAVFPAVPAILRLFIASACPLDAEMARGVLAAVEGLK